MIAKLGLLFIPVILAVLSFWLVQRLVRYRIPWMVELFALPFAVGAIVYAAVAVRDFLNRAP